MTFRRLVAPLTSVTALHLTPNACATAANAASVAWPSTAPSGHPNNQSAIMFATDPCLASARPYSDADPHRSSLTEPTAKIHRGAQAEKTAQK
jgi:hypothetical protein